MLWIVFHSANEIWKAVLAYVLVAIAFTHFAVSWHRLVLSGGSAVGKLFDIQFGIREIKYFGCVCLFSVLNNGSNALLRLLMKGAIDLVSITARLTVIVILSYVLARLVLIFPLVTEGTNSVFKKSWRLTKGHVDKVLLTIAGVMFPIFLTGMVLVIAQFMFFEDVQIALNNFIFFGIFSVAYILVTAVLVTAVTKIYLELTGSISHPPNFEHGQNIE